MRNDCAKFARPLVTHEQIIIKESPDKYTFYIKNYVGKNCANVGFTNLAGNRVDKYGDAIVELVFSTTVGAYVDINDEEALKKYVVTGQNVKLNTELKLTFDKDFDSLVDSQSIEEIEITVKTLIN